jgi:hypothetical protein
MTHYNVHDGPQAKRAEKIVMDLMALRVVPLLQYTLFVQPDE